MYWRAGSYPELIGKSKREQKDLVQAAIRTHGRQGCYRFLGAVILCMGSSILITSIITHPLISWITALIFVGPLIFYVYLLWEINGPLRSAFIKYIQQKEQIN